jgi:DNA modification methylase
VLATTLWEYPSQHYDWVDQTGVRRTMQGDKDYAGATPSWVIWQVLSRYTRQSDLIVDPMCGSGTTLDVAASLGRNSKGFDISPQRPDIQAADARALPLADHSVDFVFVDPPYSTHIEYSDSPDCIGKLDAAGEDGGRAYYAAMVQVISEAHRVLKNRRYMALYVSDSWRKKKGGPKGSGAGTFMPIGFELFAIMRRTFTPVDIICVARKNQKLDRGNWTKTAVEENFFLRGFNYLFIMKKVDDSVPSPPSLGEAKRGSADRP